jgi:hypothetical protein
MSLILKSIEEEAADCRAACANLKIGWAWLVHHGILAEPLTEPIENRISYILEYKTDNVALRLRLLRPLIEDEAMRSDDELDKALAGYSTALYDKAWSNGGSTSAGYIKAFEAYYKARAELNKSITTHYHRLFPDSPWNGKTIFAGEFALCGIAFAVAPAIG